MKKQVSAKTQPIIGWREWVSFPDLKIEKIKAKIDTGARTSALHAFGLHQYHRHDRLWLHFWVHPLQGREDVVRECHAPVVDRRWVSDSGGHRERRFVVETRINLGGQVWPIELTLSNRDSMRFRLLLGRTTLASRFLIDPHRSYCQGRGKPKKR